VTACTHTSTAELPPTREGEKKKKKGKGSRENLGLKNGRCASGPAAVGGGGKKGKGKKKKKKNRRLDHLRRELKALAVAREQRGGGGEKRRGWRSAFGY